MILEEPAGSRGLIYGMGFVSILLHVGLVLLLLGLSIYLGPQTQRLPAYSVELVDMPGGRSDAEQGRQASLPAPPKQEEAKKPKPEAKPEPKPEPERLTEPKAEPPANPPKSKAPAAPTTNAQEFDIPTGGATVGFSSKGSIALDAENFEFAYYIRTITNKISSRWVPPFESVPGGKPRRVQVMFRISTLGEIYDARIETSSGIAPLDQSALRAVILCNPMPPLPIGFQSEELGVHFGFELTP
jgi:TonB family protein